MAGLLFEVGISWFDFFYGVGKMKVLLGEILRLLAQNDEMGSSRHSRY